MVLNHKEKSLTSFVRIIKEHKYHWHNCLTILKVVVGEVKVRVWARDNYLKVGDFIVFNPGEVHEVSGLTEMNLVSVIQIDKEICEYFCSDFESCIVLVNSYRYCDVAPEKYDALEKNHKLVTMALARDASAVELETQETIKNLILLLTQEFDYIACGIGLKRFSEAVVKRYKTMFKEIFKTQPSLSTKSLKDIALELGIHYSYLRSDIVQRYGFGFQWLKNTYKTEKAARMIMETDQSIMSICLQCGFSDPKYFIKYFKIFFECTPSEFRKQHKQHLENMSHQYVDLEMHHVVKLMDDIM